MGEDATKKTCFIAMPITTQPEQVELYGGDKDHWIHVMESIHVPAVIAAGFEPIRPVTSGTQMIMGEIIKHLSQADMVLCDLSGHNPNVFFELGVRTSLNLPIALVKDERTSIPFDTSGLNTHQYDSTLHAWNSEQQVAKVEQHITASATGASGQNAMWKHFGLTITAERPESDAPSSTDAQIALIFESLNDLRREMSAGRSGTSIELFGRPSSGLAIAVRDIAFELARLLLAKVGLVHPVTDNTFEIRLTKRADLSLTADLHRELSETAERYGFVLRHVTEREDEFIIMVELLD